MVQSGMEQETNETERLTEWQWETRNWTGTARDGLFCRMAVVPNGNAYFLMMPTVCHPPWSHQSPYADMWEYANGVKTWSFFSNIHVVFLLFWENMSWWLPALSVLYQVILLR